ncbi:hydroxyacylglutathione hydrolase [Pseudomonas sp. VI4.1]|uniref:hydroxyacylglutathione hydrolase n=1 Tax=Pseudomonas sp. VI4.1 TaxID=1941346 RepID=UPI0026CE421C
MVHGDDMKVVRHYVENELRNFNYLLGCDRTHQAIVIDPLDHQAVLSLADQHGWTIRVILNTHEHHDHIDGNPFVRQVTGAEVWAHRNLCSVIPHVAKGLVENEFIELGDIRLKVLFTPGHTSAHVCFVSIPKSPADSSCFFSGDTLFNASAGNCRNGGNVHDLYATFSKVISSLPDSTLLYPGHDYLLNNLNFALSCDEKNQHAAMLREKVLTLSGSNMPIMNLGEERQYNPFLRLEQPEIRHKVCATYPELSCEPHEIFTGLRRLRDNW